MTEIEQGTGVGRRAFLQRGAAVAAGVAALTPLDALAARTAEAGTMRRWHCSPDYGPLYPVKDQTTGLELLELPRGFEYLTFGWTGDRMADGTVTPADHDGMAAFRRRDGKLTLVRNHEQTGYDGAFTAQAYDPMARGGTSTLVFDPDAGALVEDWASLSGTVRNCAGGPTPWGTWLSCEETTEVNPVNGTRHGYVFEVPTAGHSDAKPIKAMGRFEHEAVAVDPDTGYVYLTEDDHNAGLYRYRPKVRGALAAGGTLEQLVINGGGNYDTRADTTGARYRTGWLPVDNVDPAPGETRIAEQGFAKGAARFARLEGAWYHRGKVYIVSTSGQVSQGQVFEYDPRRERMRVLFSSPDPNLLNMPDNITVSPRDGIVLCEDGGGDVEFLHGLTLDGEIFRFAENAARLPGGVKGKPAIRPGNYANSEWCGATFEPGRGRWLFVNIQKPGITVAITGPWHRGSL
jgi:secreted PhoX family phosphatase